MTIILCGLLLATACTPVPPPGNTGNDGEVSIPMSPPEEALLPREIELRVPFSPQSPYADWTDPRQQEGCEEMSLIMVHHYLEGTGLERQQAFDELMALSDWEDAHGYPLDVTIAQLAEIAQQYYGYKATVSDDVSVDAIKQLTANGNPVIVPAAGRELKNPYFSGEGPWYHMLVITGYDRNDFVTNDPGTRRGKDYRYRYKTLIDAIHDWTGVKEETGQGRKAMLILEKVPEEIPANSSGSHSSIVTMS